MRDKIGDHADTIDALFEQMAIIKARMDVLTQRINWLENPDTVPKRPQTKPASEPEGKL